jgi:SagB-type dehydrogenase family enzyme
MNLLIVAFFRAGRRVYVGLVGILLAGTLCPGMIGSVSAQEESSMSIGPRFHEETSNGVRGAKGSDLTRGRQLPAYKAYPERPKIKLPSPAVASVTVDEAITRRESVREFTDRTVTLAELSRILISADGLTRPWGTRSHRATASAGALYPIELYVIAVRIDSLEPGLYHFQPKDTSLALVKAGDLSPDIHEACGGQDAVGSSPLTIVITARFERVTQKYADRGYRYVYMESGAVGQNIYLQATALGMGTVEVGAFNDDAVNRLLGIDGHEEAALLVHPAGYPAK